MTVLLYSLVVSHPSVAVHLMLDRKQIDHRVRQLPPGLHPLAVRFAGFRGNPVPALRIDGLIAADVVGTDERNAADYQIATTLRVLMSFADLRPGIEGRPAGELALRLVPRWPEEVPPFLPPEWLAGRPPGPKARDEATPGARRA